MTAFSKTHRASEKKKRDKERKARFEVAWQTQKDEAK
jgi:hypothetical protein